MRRSRVTADGRVAWGEHRGIMRGASAVQGAVSPRGSCAGTVVGILCGTSAGTAYYCSAILLPKALVYQGVIAALSLRLSTLLFLVTIPGKLSTEFVMEAIGREWRSLNRSAERYPASS